MGEDEADLKQNKISVTSSVARAMIGKREGDEVVIPIPKGKIEVEIQKVNILTQRVRLWVTSKRG